MKEDFKKMDAMLKKINGTSRLFRPPYGEINQPVFNFVRSQNYHVIGWSQDAKDWKYYSQTNYTEKVLKELKNRITEKSIVLMLEDNSKSIEILDEVMKLVVKSGYQSTTVSSCLGFNKIKRNKK
ncbi:glycoside hydrolase/deacetylase [Rozella allomycis CSF55]|uniref:Glycoside hydrolase/deacetylase n=1 Tax=Rozella allomycis (strain CSF55) TaxID=988480 RepID=A0A075AXS7_ROZAC|nr:Polysaccharide deacetylase domain-containing protein [Rozella allomycis CSF55]RKP19517.1 glycoside hydrolase/deacetylase [Rozella allomycis CSF55]|eukprot:EPZ33369.1 Polysaccharide deacetylase domain-containing protein [Rozella allomycis CSF55]